MLNINEISLILSTNPFFIGLSVMMMNIGSRFILSDLTQSQIHFFNNKFVKYLIVFCMFFIYTKDFLSSIILSFIFFVTLFGVFNENSRFNIIHPFSQIKKLFMQRLLENAKNDL